MKIENNLKISRLIDTYGNLLTARQYEMITSYYFDNLSLSEIGYNTGVSRQAVSDSINQSIKTLESTEEKLHIVRKMDTLTEELTELAQKQPQLGDSIRRIIEDMRG